MGEKIILMLVPEDISKKLSSRLLGLGNKLLSYFPHVEIDLKRTDIEIRADEYMATSFINASFMSIFFGFLMIFLFIAKEKAIFQSIVLGTAIGIGIFIMLFMIFMRYPDILASKKAQNIDKDLVFALKDLSLQISAGVGLYDAFISVASGQYKETSIEFKKVVQAINSGKPMVDAIEEMAINTKSEYLKRTSWQIVNTLKSGSSLKKTLRRIIEDLNIEQKSKIMNYSRELNLWSLLYMLFAVAVPSIGSTMLVILSSFAGFGITRGMFIVFIIICFIIQYILIGLVKSRRPITNI